jgi:hypothetical protein
MLPRSSLPSKSSLDYLLVRPGEEVTAELWNKLVAEVRARRIVRSTGTRVSYAPDGQTIAFERPGGFSHAWQANVAKDAGTRWYAFVAPGTINGQEAVNPDGTKLSDLAATNDPAIEIVSQKFDTRNRGFIVAEIEMKAGYSAIDKITIVQCPDLTSDSTTARPMSARWERGITGFDRDGVHRARYPIARLALSGGVVFCYQVAYWNQQHAAIPPVPPGTNQVSSGSSLARHFFWPVGGNTDLL